MGYIRKDAVEKILKAHANDKGFMNLLELVRKGKNTSTLPHPRFSVRDLNKEIVDLVVEFTQDGKSLNVYEESRGLRSFIYQFPIEDIISNKTTTATTKINKAVPEATTKIKKVVPEATTKIKKVVSTTTTTKKVARKRHTTTKTTAKSPK